MAGMLKRAPVWISVLWCLGGVCADLPTQFCRIEVIEKGSGWPVPLVELKTTHNVRFVTDNAGVIAFDLPELMGVETWFAVSGNGYERPKDGFGYRGVRLTPTPGKVLRLEVARTILAKRIGRLTGGGLFGESQKLGSELSWKDSGVLGCDSVQNAIYKGKLFWSWGDTTMPHYPLGIFDMTGATTATHPLTSPDPPLRLKFDYFRDAYDNPRAIAKMPGEGPTWLGGYATVRDATGRERLVAGYAKIKPPLEAYERGLCVWNDTTKNFEHLKTIWSALGGNSNAPPMPDGHVVLWKDGAKEWLLFGNPFPFLRCPAKFEAWQDPSTWDVIKPQEALEDAASGAAVKPHSGSIVWNAFRKRWVTVFMQAFGNPSAFGELWYAEARSPMGPWGKAVKILSHENYTFYNPRIHPEFAGANSPMLFFEGTYTSTFANRPFPTARYDYNQLLYRLDLDDPKLEAACGEH